MNISIINFNVCETRNFQIYDICQTNEAFQPNKVIDFHFLPIFRRFDTNTIITVGKYLVGTFLSNLTVHSKINNSFQIISTNQNYTLEAQRVLS